MRNINPLLLIPIFACALFSCKKSDNIGGKTANTSLIVGKWLSYQQNTKVYDLTTNVLLKDTLLTLNPANTGEAWFEIYNTDGSAYVTSTPYKKAGSTVLSVDTTAYLHYTILGASLTLKPNGGGSETDPIIKLTQTDMELEKTHNKKPNPGWGLDVAVTYNFVEDTYYTRQ